MRMPDVTKAQWLALVGGAVSVAVAFGVPLTPDQQKALLAFSALVIGVLVHSDVKIRGNRAANADKIKAAATRPPRITDPPPAVPETWTFPEAPKPTTRKPPARKKPAT